MTTEHPPARRSRPASTTARRVAVAIAVTVMPIVAGGSAASAGAAWHTPDPGQGSPEFYRVQRGDGFYAVASSVGVDINSLLARNGLPIDYELHPGFVLIVPEEGFVPPSTVPPATTAPPETAPPQTAPPETAPPQTAPPQQAAAPAPTSPPQSVETAAPPATEAPTTAAPTTAAPTTAAPTTAPPTTPPPPPPTTPPPPPPPSGTGDCVVGGIGWINNARANEGVAGVSQGDASAACGHSRNMAESGSMYHGAGSCGWEIVGYHSHSWENLPGMWLNSSSHYQVVTDSRVSTAAVAYVQNLSTGYWYGTGILCP